uniref:Uncharacterized protein n=1 Tax=Ditylenchus dipsaci TaxID=166011 RepID=A0A915CKP1_9BILA
MRATATELVVRQLADILVLLEQGRIIEGRTEVTHTVGLENLKPVLHTDTVHDYKFRACDPDCEQTNVSIMRLRVLGSSSDKLTDSNWSPAPPGVVAGSAKLMNSQHAPKSGFARPGSGWWEEEQHRLHETEEEV